MVNGYKTAEGATRRDFVRTLAGGATALWLSKMLERAARASTGEKIDIGACKSLRVRCISETSWFDGAELLQDIKNAGGPSANQYEIRWSKKNSGGYSALVEVEALDGTWRRFLLDVGWNPAWMEYCFQREGIDDMLRNGDIEFVYISHEHMDHFWGLPVVTKYRPDIQLVISDRYYPEGKGLIQKSGHKGRVVELGPGKVHALMPGCVSVTFDIPILIRVQGEHALFFNVKDKGIVTVTGCCHMGVLNLMKFAKENLVGGGTALRALRWFAHSPVRTVGAQAGRGRKRSGQPGTQEGRSEPLHGSDHHREDALFRGSGGGRKRQVWKSKSPLPRKRG